MRAKLLVPALLGLMASTLGASELTEVIDGSQTNIRHWTTTLEDFGDKVNQVFSRVPDGQRSQIESRVKAVREQTERETKALQSIEDAFEAFDDGSNGLFGLGGSRNRKLVDLVEEFRNYQSLFSWQVRRTFLDGPQPRWERLYENWRSIPWYHTGRRQEAREAFEKEFLPFAKEFVSTTQKSINVRRKAFYHALRSLQFSNSVLDFTLAFRFDRVFYSYQALFAEPIEAGYGLPEYPDFPVNAATQYPIEFKANWYGKQFVETKTPKAEETRMPARYGRSSRGRGDETLSAEAQRIRELHDLTARYESASQTGSNVDKGEIWNRYEEMRERWDHHRR